MFFKFSQIIAELKSNVTTALEVLCKLNTYLEFCEMILLLFKKDPHIKVHFYGDSNFET